jgi:cation diffusion facilitator CzcD-associated flavoprotein CzcO
MKVPILGAGCSGLGAGYHLLWKPTQREQDFHVAFRQTRSHVQIASAK